MMSEPEDEDELFGVASLREAADAANSSLCGTGASRGSSNTGRFELLVPSVRVSHIRPSFYPQFRGFRRGAST